MDKRGGVTIKDIARELGVAPSTVSRALKNHPDISKKMVEAVKALAEKYHYMPNSVALALRNSKTNIIGVLIPGFDHYFFSSILSGIEHIAHELGYAVVMCQSDENPESELACLHTLLNARVDGILISLTKNTTDFSLLQQIKDNKIPLVFFDRTTEKMKADKVIIDDVEGAMCATNHLIEAGCRQIIHMSASQTLEFGRKRKEGYCLALEKHGIAFSEDMVFECDNRDEALVVMQEIADKGIKFDGIFTVNDSTAIGVLKVLKMNGYRIPQDIKVISFSDGYVATVIEPSLTTIDQHGYDMGVEAVNLLIDRIRGEETSYSPVTKVIPVNLVLRESTRIYN